MEKAVLYTGPLKHTALLHSSISVWCALLLHYLRWCIHWKWPYTSVNMSSHWWWHPKSLTSNPSPTVGHHSTNELLYTFCGDYPLSLTMSANDRAGTVLKVFFTPTLSHVHVRGRASDREGWKLHHPSADGLFVYFSLSLSLSGSLLLLSKDTRNRSSYTLWDYQEVDNKNVTLGMSWIRS